MKKKIYWITINEFYFEIDILLVKKLIKKGNNITIITNNNNIEKKYLKENIECINVGKEKIINNGKKLEKFLIKYNFINPEKKLWQRELKIYGINKKYLEQSSLDYFIFFEKLFKNKQFILFHNGDHYFYLIAEKVAKNNNGKIIYHNSIGLFDNSLVFTNSWEYNNFNNEKYLKDILSDKEIQRAKNIILTKINKKPLIGGKRKIITFLLIKKFFYYFLNKFFRGNYKNDYTPLKSLLKYFIKRIYNNKFNKINYDNFRKVNKKTLYFPMHVPNDAQITTRAYKFINQLEITKEILEILPKGYKLAIKEHPHGVGMLNMQDFAKLREKHNNLIILEPKVNSYDIINKCYTTITINSDVGYETIILGKKPITMHKSFYSGYGFTIDIDLFNINKNIFLDIINNRDLEINMKDRIQFIYSLLKVHKKGIFFKNSKLEFNLDKENIDNLVLNINNITENENKR